MWSSIKFVYKKCVKKVKGPEVLFNSLLKRNAVINHKHQNDCKNLSNTHKVKIQITYCLTYFSYAISWAAIAF